MTALTEAQPRALQLADDEIIPVLQSSLYPGAKPESIKLVIGYCKAAGLDPMQKPVHLVPMYVKKVGGGRDDYEWRDVVMPGIGLYRTQAARTGELAGIDEPVFGPMVSKFGVEFPDFCKVTVYRMIGGQRVPFTACEFWLENYATQKRDSDAPNAMWKKRPRGQLAKCAEAQALRKAFPELGSQPTADETVIDPSDVVEVPTTGTPAPASRVARKTPTPAPAPADVEDATVVGDPPKTPEAPAAPAAAAKTTTSAPAPAPTAGGDDLIGPGERAYLTKKAESIGASLDEILADLGGLVLDKLSKADFQTVKSELIKRGG